MCVRESMHVCAKKDVKITAIAAEAETLAILAGTAMLEPALPAEVAVTTLPAASSKAAAAKTVAIADTTTIAVHVIASNYHINTFPLTVSLR